MLRGGAFKPRTSPYDFQGLKAEGLELLKIARQETGLPIVTEIMGIELPAALRGRGRHSGRRAQYAELRPAARARQAETSPSCFKRGLASTLKELLMSAEYIMAGGNEQVILCERGIRTYDDYTRNTLDLAAVPMLNELTHLPVIVDPSHATGIARLVRRWRWPRRPAARTASSSRCTTTPSTPCATARSPCARSSTTTSPRRCAAIERGGRGMTVGIVGLGLIGGSFAKAYHDAGGRCSPGHRPQMLDFRRHAAARWTAS